MKGNTLQAPVSSLTGIAKQLTVTDSTSLPAEVRAAILFIERKERIAHPKGSTDNAGRWYPSCRDKAVFPSNEYRSPSRAYPWSYMLACRTAAQCARIYDADLTDTRRIANAIKKVWDGKESVAIAATRISPIKVKKTSSTSTGNMGTVSKRKVVLDDNNLVIDQPEEWPTVALPWEKEAA